MKLKKVELLVGSISTAALAVANAFGHSMMLPDVLSRIEPAGYIIACASLILGLLVVQLRSTESIKMILAKLKYIPLLSVIVIVIISAIPDLVVHTNNEKVLFGLWLNDYGKEKVIEIYDREFPDKIDLPESEKTLTRPELLRFTDSEQIPDFYKWNYYFPFLLLLLSYIAFMLTVPLIVCLYTNQNRRFG